jgi:ABC-type Fe3+-siderophore transport system permease subunit
MLLVLIWGVFRQELWHDEVLVIRAGAGTLLVVLAAAGLWSRQWKWVFAAGIAGLAGLTIWILWLISTHPAEEIVEIFKPGFDGIPNGIAFAGALLVLVAGLIGMRAHSATR